MDMKAYKKDMILYIESLSAKELEAALIVAGAKKVNERDRPKNDKRD